MPPDLIGYRLNSNDYNVDYNDVATNSTIFCSMTLIVFDYINIYSFLFDKRNSAQSTRLDCVIAL